MRIHLFFVINLLVGLVVFGVMLSVGHGFGGALLRAGTALAALQFLYVIWIIMAAWRGKGPPRPD